MCRQISVKLPNIKICENPLSRSRVVTCGQTDGHRAKLIRMHIFATSALRTRLRTFVIKPTDLIRCCVQDTQNFRCQNLDTVRHTDARGGITSISCVHFINFLQLRGTGFPNSQCRYGNDPLESRTFSLCHHFAPAPTRRLSTPSRLT
jgi:hypothetical protein